MTATIPKDAVRSFGSSSTQQSASDRGMARLGARREPPFTTDDGLRLFETFDDALGLTQEDNRQIAGTDYLQEYPYRTRRPSGMASTRPALPCLDQVPRVLRQLGLTREARGHAAPFQRPEGTPASLAGYDDDTCPRNIRGRLHARRAPFLGYQTLSAEPCE